MEGKEKGWKWRRISQVREDEKEGSIRQCWQTEWNTTKKETKSWTGKERKNHTTRENRNKQQLQTKQTKQEEAKPRRQNTKIVSSLSSQVWRRDTEEHYSKHTVTSIDLKEKNKGLEKGRKKLQKRCERLVSDTCKENVADTSYSADISCDDSADPDTDVNLTPRSKSNRDL